MTRLVGQLAVIAIVIWDNVKMVCEPFYPLEKADTAWWVKNESGLTASCRYAVLPTASKIVASAA